MNAHEHFVAGSLLVAEIADLPASRWPSDARSFAVAAESQAAQGNRFAAQFWVSMGSAGKDCYDFRVILSLMHSATLISYDSQETDRFNVRISKRGAQHIWRRTEVAPGERDHVKALILAHWEEAYGRPWKEDL